jgi:signal peptide peptidase SppA
MKHARHFPRILAAIRSARWAVMPATLHAIGETLSARMSGKLGVPRMADDMPGEMGQPEDDGPQYEKVGTGSAVAVVPMHGIIGRRLSGMEMECGGCDIARVEEAVTAAIADPEVGALVLDIDSPGGTVGGVDEFRQKLTALSVESGKPILAFASGQLCSAAYWIACGCTAGICASSSSDVGSIGVYVAIVDESAAWEKEGYRLVLIKAGEHKADGIAGSAVTPEQIARWQEDVDYIYGQFTSAVKAARPGVGDDIMQGQTFYGPRAQAVGLTDATYPDLAACLADFTGTSAAR